MILYRLKPRVIAGFFVYTSAINVQQDTTTSDPNWGY
jgi:hypothetical protein